MSLQNEVFFIFPSFVFLSHSIRLNMSYMENVLQLASQFLMHDGKSPMLNFLGIKYNMLGPGSYLKKCHWCSVCVVKHTTKRIFAYACPTLFVLYCIWPLWIEWHVTIVSLSLSHLDSLSKSLSRFFPAKPLLPTDKISRADCSANIISKGLEHPI